jgi:hypothetical protein
VALILIWIQGMAVHQVVNKVGYSNTRLPTG